MLEKLTILFQGWFLVYRAETLEKSGFLVIFVTLPRVRYFGYKQGAGFVNCRKKWPQYH